MMEMQAMEQEKLYRFIQEVGFAVIDINLYLDTHPCDRAALGYYRKYRDLLKHASEEYARLYGPLVATAVESDCFFDWVEEPWPWRGGK